MKINKSIRLEKNDRKRIKSGFIQKNTTLTSHQTWEFMKNRNIQVL